jgi:hypothetical protein
MTPQEKLSELQKLLLVSPQADKVYFNEVGDYQLYDHPEYQHEIVGRDEVLAADVEETTEGSESSAPTKSAKKKINN